MDGDEVLLGMSALKQLEFTQRDGTLVGDARFLILKNMTSQEDRAELLDQVRRRPVG